MNLNEMSLEDLKALRLDLNQRIENYDAKLRREALHALERVADEYGYKLSDLVKVKKTEKGTLPPKYADPADPSNTWSGKGRKPAWFVAQLDAGKTREDMLI